MRRCLLVILGLFALVGLSACSNYPHEFEEEPLIIYDVQISDVKSSSAIISWKTNKKADSQAYYKTAASFESSETNDGPVLDHELTLSGLVADRTYYLSLKGAEADGTEVAFVDGLSFHTEKAD